MTTKEAKEVLKNAGYFVDNLWHVNDVQTRFECSDEQAYNILYWSIENDQTIQYINETIQTTINNLKHN